MKLCNGSLKNGYEPIVSPLVHANKIRQMTSRNNKKKIQSIIIVLQNIFSDISNKCKDFDRK